MAPSAVYVVALSALSFTIGLARPVSRSELLPSYDYVVVGGGTSGLTVANRLSENANVTVLVIEAGPFDENEDFIRIPGLAGGGIGSRYDWNLSYAPNDVLGGQVQSLPQGKAVGGTTKINIMTFDRGSRSDYDRWETLGLQGWNWSSFLNYFKRTEEFTPATPEITAEYNVTVDPAVHGYNGHVHSTYSPFYWPTTANFVNAFRELDIHIPLDAGNGEAYGGYFTPHNQDPVTATRSSAREAYYETAKNRANFHLLSDTQVTRLLTTRLPGGISISGVEYSSSNSSYVGRVTVTKEAILAAGAVHTPQLLQVSGIGDTGLLTGINVTTVVNLPAVGQNFHDHVHFNIQSQINAALVQANLTNNATFAAEARDLYDREHTGPLARAGGDFLGYLPLVTYSNVSLALQKEAAVQNGTSFLAPETPPEVIAGYTAIHNVLTERLSAPDSALIEVTWGDGNIGLSLQAPYSRGSVRAASSSVFDPPIVDPRVLHNPLDVSFLVEAIKFARVITQTEAISELQPIEITPGTNVTSDGDLARFVLENASPAWHLAGSCKIGRREEGGVVDERLKVYGVDNLRVVDASIMPFLPASHPMTTVYSVAEKAADIIKGEV